MDMRLEPLTGPMVWTADNLQSLTNWQHALTGAELAEIDAALSHAKASGKQMYDITADDFPLPTLAPEIAKWMDVINNGAGLFNITGLPRDNYSKDDMALIHWGLGAHFGTPVSQNAAGDLLGHVVDTGANPIDRDVRGYRTNAELGFHSDGSDIVSLMCLNKARWGGYNRIVSCATIYNEVLKRRPDLIPLMYEPFYWDNHGQQAEGQPPYFALPMCSYQDGHFRFFYIGWYIRNAQRHPEVPRLTAEQVQLLDLIDLIAYDPAFHVQFQQQPGDINLVKNATVLHMRTTFEDFEEPEKKRHLVRLWLTAHGHWADGDAFVQQGIAKKDGVRSDAETLG